MGEVPSLEVFADIGCPFAHVGLRMARRRRDELGLTVPLLIRAWPLELVNGKGQDPWTVASHVAALREQVDPALFGGFDPGAFPTSTLPALSLAAQAYRYDDGLGELVSLALRDALFEEGRDPSRREILTDIASRFGLPDVRWNDRQFVIEEWREGQRRGVEGSPHFYCLGMSSFCPSLDISRDDLGRMQLQRNSKRLFQFLDACFLGDEEDLILLDGRSSPG